MPKALGIIALTTALSAGVAAAQPHSVGVNFYEGGATLPNGPLFDAAGGINDFAGTPTAIPPGPVPRQMYWNDVAGGPNTGVGIDFDLMDATGTSTTIDVDWNGTDIVAQAGWTGGTSDSRMFNGSVVELLGGPLTVNFYDIPGSYTAGGYDVIIYADNEAAYLVQQFSLYDLTGTTLLRGPITLSDVQEPTQGDTEVTVGEYDLGYRTNAPGGTNDFQGNYIVFEDIDEAGFQIRSDALTGSFEFISGVQIVPSVPEPASAMTLLGLGGLLTLRRRRRA